MVALIFLFLNLVASPFKPKSRLEAENAALRQQLIVLRRKVRGRVRFTNSDRVFFIQLYRWCPSVLKAMMIIQPETLVRWPTPAPNRTAAAASLSNWISSDHFGDRGRGENQCYPIDPSRLLRAGPERPRSRRTAEQRYELAAPHSITSSAATLSCSDRCRPWAGCGTLLSCNGGE
jgi:hypothetical protein